MVEHVDFIFKIILSDLTLHKERGSQLDQDTST